MTKPKRLLSLSTLYPNGHTPRFGTFVARSLEALAARGNWDVTVINPVGIPPVAFGKYKPLAAAAQNGVEFGVQVYRPTFTLIPKIGARINPAMITRAVLPLARRLHAEHPFDLVDAQFFYPDGPAAIAIAQALGLPCSIKARGSDISYWGKQPFAARQMLHAASKASGLLAVSTALARDMAAMGMDADKITLNYTGLDRDRFRPIDHSGLRGKLNQSLGLSLSENQPLFTTVGALIERKGQELVIRALATVPGAHLLLVGNGPDEKQLRTIVRDLGLTGRVNFLGSVDHDLLPVILSASDAMVLPSSSEGLANAWVEALACGTPLVISNVGGARELVTGPEAGLIVERSAEAVAQGMRDTLKTPPNREAAVAIAERFSWTENAQSLAEYYDRLLSS